MVKCRLRVDDPPGGLHDHHGLHKKRRLDRVIRLGRFSFGDDSRYRVAIRIDGQYLDDDSVDRRSRDFAQVNII